MNARRCQRLTLATILATLVVVGCNSGDPDATLPVPQGTAASDRVDEAVNRSSLAYQLPRVETEGFEATVTDQINSAIRNIESADPRELDDRLGRLGMIYHCMEVNWAAKQCYEAASAASKTDFRWPHLLAHLARIEGDHRLAMQRFTDSLAVLERHETGNVQAKNCTQCWLGEIALQSGETETAQKWFGQVVADADENAFAHYSLGRIAEQDEQLESARKHLERADEIRPNVAGIQFLLGTVYRKLGQREKARQYLESSAVNSQPLSPDDPLLWDVQLAVKSHRRYQFLGDQNFKAGRYQGAAEFYLAALQLEAEEEALTQTHCNLGCALSKLGQYTEAVAHWKRAAAIRPEHTPTLLNLAEFAAQTEQKSKAIDLYRGIIAREPHNRKAKRKLADLLIATRPDATGSDEKSTSIHHR